MSATNITVADETPRRQYTASGGQTVFDFPIPFFEEGDLEVYLTPVGQTANDTNDLLTITTDYTVNGENTQDGGEIVLVVAATAGDIVTIERIVDIERLADYQTSGDLLAETLNREQDTEIFIAQQLRQDIQRAIVFGKTSTTQGAEFVGSPVEGRALLWDANGDLINSTDTFNNIVTDAEAAKTAAEAAATDAQTAEAAAESAAETTRTIYSTVSQMVSATDLVIGMKVQTAGYFSAGDGGGNIYEIVGSGTGTVDGGRFIDLTGSGLQAKGLFVDEQVIAKQFGVKGDGRTVTATATIASSDTTLTTSSAVFSASDEGKLISVFGAGASGLPLGTTIESYVSDTEVVLADAASTALSSSSVQLDIGTDDTDALTKCFSYGRGGKVYLSPGNYMITRSILIYSNTSVIGVYGNTTFLMAAKYTGTSSYEGAAIQNSTFATATELTETDITVSQIDFNYYARPQGSTNGQRVSVFLRYVERCKVSRCVQYGGQLTGFLRCQDTEIDSNVAYECYNAAYDQWSSTGYAIVTNNINRNLTIAPNQCIQITGDDTTPGSDALLGTGKVTKIIVSNNIIDVIQDDGNVAGIIVNCLDPGASAEDVIINSNYVKGAALGIVLEGNVNGFIISNNLVKEATSQGVFITDGGNGTPYPRNGIISNNNILTPGAIGIDLVRASGIVIDGNKVSSPVTRSLRLQADTSNILVQNNKFVDGASAAIQNLGTSNTILLPEKPTAYSGAQAFPLGTAPTSWTNLDMSAIVGTNRALVFCRVSNQTGSTAKFLFRSPEHTNVDPALGTTSFSTSVCEMQNGEEQYITVMTNANGVAQWVSTVSGNAVVLVETFQPVR